MIRLIIAVAVLALATAGIFILDATGILTFETWTFIGTYLWTMVSKIYTAIPTRVSNGFIFALLILALLFGGIFVTRKIMVWRRRPRPAKPPAPALVIVPPALVVGTVTAPSTSTTTPDDKLPSYPDRSQPNAVTSWLEAQIAWHKKELERKKEKHAKETPLVDEKLFKLIVYGVIAFAVATFVGTYFFVPSMIKIWGIPVNLQYFVYVLVILYLLAGFKIVDTDEIAGTSFFGTPVHQFKSGIKWVPWLILQFLKEKASFTQAQFPGDADRIDWGYEKDNLGTNMVRPIRVLFGEKPGATLATELQLTAGVVFFAKWSLIETRLFDLIKRIRPIDATNKEVIKRTITGGSDLTDVMYEVVRHLRDTGEAIVTEIAGQMSYSEMTGNLTLVSELLKLRLQTEVAEWGIYIEEARINALNPGHTFNEGLQKRADARNTRDATISVAEGNKQQAILVGEGQATAMITVATAKKKELTLEGQGRASAELAHLKARGKGYAAIAAATGADGTHVINTETAGKLAQAGNVVAVGTEGVTQLMGIVAATKKVGA